MADNSSSSNTSTADTTTSSSTPSSSNSSTGDSSSNNTKQSALLGSGCFWCTEAVFDEVPGVVGVTSGYAGGEKPNPTYEQICNGNTGHAEVVKLDYDPSKIDFDKVLDIFFATHDPTQLNRQGNDVGTQYRSVIYYNTPEQKAIAEKRIQQYKDGGYPVVTKLEPAPEFFKAEDYHQQYFKKNPFQGYCQVMIPPKLAKRDKVVEKNS